MFYDYYCSFFNGAEATYRIAHVLAFPLFMGDAVAYLVSASHLRPRANGRAFIQGKRLTLPGTRKLLANLTCRLRVCESYFCFHFPTDKAHGFDSNGFVLSFFFFLLQHSEISSKLFHIKQSPHVLEEVLEEIGKVTIMGRLIAKQRLL